MFPSPQDLLKRISGNSSFSLFDPSNAPPTPASVLSKAQQTASPGPVQSFGSKLLSIGGGLVKSAVSAASSFLGTQAKNVGDAVTGQLTITPHDLLEGTKQTFSGAFKGADFIAKGINEGVSRIIKSTATGVLGPELTSKISNASFGPLSIHNFASDISGKPEISTYQTIYDKSRNFALENNADEHQANVFSGLTVIGALFADNPLIGPGKGSVVKLSEDAIKEIAAATTDDAVKAIFKREVPAMTDVELDALAPVFRDATDPKAIRASIDQIGKAIDAPIKEGFQESQDVPHPDSVRSMAERGDIPEIVPEEGGRESFFRALDTPEGNKFVEDSGTRVKIMDGLDTYVARKEKDGATFYDVIEGSTGRQIGKLSDTPEAAVNSAKEILSGKTLEEVQQRIAVHPPSPRQAPESAITEAPAPKATEGAPAPKTTPAPSNVNLVREIAAEDMPGPISEMLAKEFPNISEQAIAPIAKRLSKLQRTRDIDGMLEVARKINKQLGEARGKAGIVRKSERKAGDLPASIGEILTDAERGKYIDNVSRVIKSRDDAVIAQQEYDALWDHADQKIIDRYEELRTTRDIIRETVENSPGHELASLYQGTFLSPKEHTLEQLMSAKPKGGFDAKIEDAMGGAQDLEAAQKQLEDYLGMREQLKEVEQELREVRPKARAARVLQEMVEDVPVLSREKAGEIEELTSPDYIRKYKDISGFSAHSRDVYRNFRAVFGDKFNDVKKIILDPFDASKGAMIDEIDALADKVKAEVVDKLGIRRGSKESRAVQLYGEGKLNHEQLVEMVGSENVDKVMQGVQFFRKEYDRLLDEVNKVRAEIFPNDPKKLIPKRKDYFRHFQEMSDGFKGIIDIFENPAGIDPALAGISEFTKPKSKFLSFAQERVGKSTEEDAIGGFLNYAPTFAYAKHIDPHIGNFRYLRRRLAEDAPTPGVKEVVDTGAGEKLVKQKGINNFLTFLDHFGNNLAGKTNPMDRYLQEIVPGGRMTFRAINWINRRVKANTILGNVSSAVAQIFNVPQGIASAKLYSLPGIKRTLSGILTPNEPMAASSFLKERYKGNLASDFKLSWVDHPIKAPAEQGKEMAAWITGVLDEVGTKFIWNSHYAKAIAEGMEDPIKYADDVTRDLVAGRGVGEVPLIQQSKVFQLVAPFTLEVGNLWRVMGDFVKRKDFGALATLLVANYLMNRAAEDVRGSPVTFDPIEALIDGATQASDELKDTGDAKRAAFKFMGRQVGEVLSNVPLGQTFAAAISDKGLQNISGGSIQDKKDLFGVSDPGRFGSGLVSFSGFADPLYKLIPPFGGVQAKKTIQGIMSMISGEVRDAGDKLTFNQGEGLRALVQAFLFGKNATSEAQKAYDERDDLFARLARQDLAGQQKRIEAEGVYEDVKKLSPEEAVKKMQALEESDPDLADAVGDVAEDAQNGLTGPERLIKMLHVENGERAKYIAERVRGMKDKSQQIAYLQNLDDKKLISADVFDQLTYLLQGVFTKPE